MSSPQYVEFYLYEGQEPKMNEYHSPVGDSALTEWIDAASKRHNNRLLAYVNFDTHTGKYTHQWDHIRGHHDG